MYTPPEPEYIIVKKYVQLRSLDLSNGRIMVLGRRAADRSRILGVEIKKMRSSVLNPGKMVAAYRLDILDAVAKDFQ